MISMPLIGQKYECHIVIEVIEVDELDEGFISVAAGKQDKLNYIQLDEWKVSKISNQFGLNLTIVVAYQKTGEYNIYFMETSFK